MKKLTIIALFAALGFASCKDTKAEATTTETKTETTNNTATDEHAGHNHGVEPTTTATPGEAPADGINPAHGQPGHRCDIPVGAPLNSAPAKPAANNTAVPANQGGFLGGNNTQAATPQQAAPQQAMPKQETAPGMQGKPNPAHGQPGHRCDVQVGQPLP